MTSLPPTHLPSGQLIQPSSHTRLDIQGLRALAVLAVVLYHSGLPLPGGFAGVDVFFVISGFVITHAITRRLSANRFRLRDFYLGRVRRLLPALAAMLVIVLALSAFIGTIGSMGSTARTGGAASLINANTYLMLFETTGYFDAAATLNPLLHTWSLSVEEQFYLVVPGLLVLAWLGWRRRTVVIPTRYLLVVLGVASFVLMLVLSRHTDPSTLPGKIDFYSPFTRAWEFAAGALLVVLPASWRMSRRMADAAAVIGTVAILTGFAVIHDGVTYPSLITLLPVVGTTLVIAAGTHHGDNPVSRGFAWRPIAKVGDLSYSWSLWHWPLIGVAGILFTESATWKVTGAAASLPIAWLSYRYVENPLRYSPRATPPRTVLIGVVCTLVPLAMALALLSWHGEVKSNWQRDPFALHQDNLRGCDGPQSLNQKPADCTWPAADSTARAVLVGDSLAGQYTEGFTTAMNRAGVTAQVATLSGCPFLDWGSRAHEAVDLGITTDPDCARFVSQTMTDLLRRPPSLVVFTSSAQRFIPGGRGGLPGASDAARAVLITQTHAEMMQRLRDAGSQVALIAPLPKFPGWGPYVDGPFKEATVVSVLTIGSPFTPTMSQGKVDAMLLGATAAERDAALASGATFLEFRSQVCGKRGCSVKGPTDWTYRDYEHLSVAMSYRLTPVFADLAASLH